MEKLMPNTKWSKWRDTKIKNDGWRRVDLFVPEPLAKQVKELCRKWKYENPIFYKKR